MMKEIYTVEHIELIDGYNSISIKAYTSYEKAAEAYKAKIGEVFILNRIHDAMIDDQLPNIKHMYENVDGLTFVLYNKYGQDVEEVPSNAKDFNTNDVPNACAGELTMEFGDTLIILRKIEEES